MMDNEPTFSIVIPSYNYGHFLAGAIDSVLAQDCADIQILVIDDASEDQTPDVARRYGHGIQYVRNAQNLGAAGNWRKGLGLARGRYVMKLDADDELLPGCLNAIEPAFACDPAAAMVISSVFIKRDRTDKLEAEYVTDHDQTLDAAEFRARLLRHYFFRMPGCALRRECVLDHDGPDTDLFQIHDWEFFLRVTRDHRVVLLNEPRAVYREHGQSITAVACHESRLFRDVQHWIDVARRPGEKFLEPIERNLLKGSLAVLLVTGFGSYQGDTRYRTFINAYTRGLKVSCSGGLRQIGRLHHALVLKVIKAATCNFR